MLLPPYVTGLYGRKEGPTSLTDYRAFRGHCYSAAREVGGAVRNVLAPRWEDRPCSYGIADIERRDEVVTVMVNGVFPLLGFVTTEGKRLGLELAVSFERLGGYTLLSAEQLDQPLTPEMCQALAEHELKRVKYFRPRCVRDVIFNEWD